MEYKYLFGPVPSRRLGVSLGIDIVPPKTCNLNCIYCECGYTTKHINSREEFCPLEELKTEIISYFKTPKELDFITFSGAGEPLLYLKIGEVIDFIKSNYPEYKLALLTNGILLSNENVIKSIKNLDLIVPSLDTGFEETFKKINHPCKDIDFNEYIKGLINLKKNFNGEIWLEIFFVKNFNDSRKELERLKEIAEKISPDKIQLNTVDRPPANKSIEGVGYNELLKIKEFFGDRAEIIKRFRNKKVISEDKLDLIKNCLKRRPLTLEDLTDVTSLKINEINKILDILGKENCLEEIVEQNRVFYKLK